MPRDFLHPNREIQKHGDDLPHWQQGEAMQFVTFRLGDALPASRIREWKEQRSNWLSTYPKPWDAATEGEYHRRFSMKLEYWLDDGHGSCLLKEPGAREVLAGALMRFQNERVIHEAWVIMPNHVHLLFKPLAPIEKLVQAWKAYSSLHIGKGPIWQRNYRDTLIRDQNHFISVVRYIRNNPVKAKLPDASYTLWLGEKAARIP
jgi:REP element-mobilizing transposase RayT